MFKFFFSWDQDLIRNLFRLSCQFVYAWVIIWISTMNFTQNLFQVCWKHKIFIPLHVRGHPCCPSRWREVQPISSFNWKMLWRNPNSHKENNYFRNSFIKHSRHVGSLGGYFFHRFFAAGGIVFNTKKNLSVRKARLEGWTMRSLLQQQTISGPVN